LIYLKISLKSDFLLSLASPILLVTLKKKNYWKEKNNKKEEKQIKSKQKEEKGKRPG
jgi:hypothetical protein